MSIKPYKELAKTIALSALIAGLVAFIAGVHYQQSQDHLVQTAVKAASK